MKDTQQTSSSQMALEPGEIATFQPRSQEPPTCLSQDCSSDSIGGAVDPSSATNEECSDGQHSFDFLAKNKPTDFCNSNRRRTLTASTSSSSFSSDFGVDLDVDDQDTDDSKQSMSQRWTQFVLMLQSPIKRLLVAMAVHAARFPRLYLVSIFGISLALAYAGYSTNFRIENREEALWAPTGSLPELHQEWVDSIFLGKKDDSRRRLVDLLGGFAQQQQYPSKWETLLPFSRDDASVEDGKSGRLLQETGSARLAFLVHADGLNVVSKEGAERNFEALDRLKTVAGYNEFCTEYGTTQCPREIGDLVCFLSGIPIEEDAPKVCQTAGMTGLWFHNSTTFENKVDSDYDVQKTMAVNFFPEEEDKFDITNFVGNPKYKTVNGTKLMVSSTAYLTGILLPKAGFGDYPRLMDDLLDALLQLQEEWEADTENAFRLEVFNTGAYEDEFNRGIIHDLKLVPIVGVLMMGFTLLVFCKSDWIQSQCVLGFGAVACVIMSLLSSYGIMFTIGYPFTSLSLALVFIIFGIGLDDSFILYSAYVRTNANKSGEERVRDTMDEVAISIFMTTATTALAFALGALSQIPAVQWLCVYASTAIGIDFIYQITFFVACIAVDDARIKAGRRDCCVCFQVNSVQANDDDGEKNNGCEDGRDCLDGCDGSTTPSTEESSSVQSSCDNEQAHISSRVMSWYAGKLLRPYIKVIILLVFAAFFGVCLWSTLQLKVHFDFLSVLPSDSYVTSFSEAANLYTNQEGPDTFIYFRNVDHSDPAVWAQMEDYVDAIVSIDDISHPPTHFWLQHYKQYVAEHEDELHGLTFNEKLDEFLNGVREKHNYRGDMLFDDEGNLIASRAQVHFDKINAFQISDGVDALVDQRAVTEAQPINQESEKGEWNFFTFRRVYLLWEFLLITPKELMHSTLVGIGCVSAMSIFFIPHWSGTLFVTPLVMILYVNLLGFIQFFQIEINGISFVSIVMAIGPLVDFIMHVVLKYFETNTAGSPDAKVKEVLETMGASVLLGGLSSFLSILPLMFSSNDIIFTFVITFCGVVLLGLTHGLVLLPVLLSIVGPRAQNLSNDSESSIVAVRKVKSESGRDLKLIDV